MRVHRINVKEAAKRMMLDVKVTGVKVFAIRCKVGLWLIRMGCKVIGCNVRVGDDAIDKGKFHRAD